VVFEQAILRRAQHFGKGVAGAYYGSLFIKIRKIHNTLLIKVVGVKPMQLPDISRGTIIGNIGMGLQLRKKDAFFITHVSAGKVCEPAQAHRRRKLAGTSGKPSQFGVFGQNARYRCRVQRILRHLYQPLLLLKVCGHHRAPVTFHACNGRSLNSCIAVIGGASGITRHDQRMVVLARQ
jgi:hypothetical protein